MSGASKSGSEFEETEFAAVTWVTNVRSGGPLIRQPGCTGEWIRAGMPRSKLAELLWREFCSISSASGPFDDTRRRNLRLIGLGQVKPFHKGILHGAGNPVIQTDAPNRQTAAKGFVGIPK